MRPGGLLGFWLEDDASKIPPAALPAWTAYHAALTAHEATLKEWHQARENLRLLGDEQERLFGLRMVARRDLDAIEVDLAGLPLVKK